jgi:hypothetical protein
MQPSCYRLSSETLGIVRRNGHPTMATLPEGSRVGIADAKAGSCMIDVLWEGEVITMFTQDLDDRGIQEPVAGLSQTGHGKSQSRTA